MTSRREQTATYTILGVFALIALLPIVGILFTALQDQDLLVEVDGVPHRISRDEGGLIRSQAPGVVIAVPVSAANIGLINSAVTAEDLDAGKLRRAGYAWALGDSVVFLGLRQHGKGCGLEVERGFEEPAPPHAD